MKQTLRYVFKVWLITSLIPPLLYILIAFIWERDSIAQIWTVPLVYALIALSSCVLSFPTLTVFYMATVGLQRLPLTFKLKLILIVITAEILVVATYILFLMLYPGFTKQPYYRLMTIDCIVMALAIWRYRDLLKVRADTITPMNE